MSTITPADALATILLVERQIPQYASPSKVQALFQRLTVHEDASGKQKIELTPNPQNPSARAVHETMLQCLAIVAKDPSAIDPHDQKAVGRFQEHMALLAEMEQARPTEGETARASPLPSAAIPSVIEVKQQISSFFRPFGSGVLEWFGGGILALSLLFGSSVMIPLMVAGGAAAATSAVFLPFTFIFGVPALIGTVVGLTMLVVYVVKRRQNEIALYNAQRPEEIVPLFESLRPEAQAKFLVELGPEFREQLCLWNEKHYHDDGMRQLCELVNTLQSDESPLEWKRKAFQSLPLKVWCTERYSFQFDELKKLLIEKQMTGGTIIAS